VKIINLNGMSISNDLPFTLIAGPCQVESKEHADEMVAAIKEITDKLQINFIYKSSFDKANRSSASSARGIGMEKSLMIFEDIKSKYNIPIVTDIHTETQAKDAAHVVDILQIPAFLCRQTDLLQAAAQTGKIIKVKKGQFLAPWDIKPIIEKLTTFNAKDIMITERGTSFGYNTLISDMRGLAIMREYQIPIVFDATHSVQQPGGLGHASGGERKFVSTLAKAALTTKIAGLFVEVHNDPDNAPSDGPCMLHLKDLSKILTQLKQLDTLVKNFEEI
jgi:2-dehydro-3-deoxyphosphooctonate aldolase (KDO 8-P synthase)